MFILFLRRIIHNIINSNTIHKPTHLQKHKSAIYPRESIIIPPNRLHDIHMLCIYNKHTTHSGPSALYCVLFVCHKKPPSLMQLPLADGAALTNQIAGLVLTSRLHVILFNHVAALSRRHARPGRVQNLAIVPTPYTLHHAMVSKFVVSLCVLSFKTNNRMSSIKITRLVCLVSLEVTVF